MKEPKPYKGSNKLMNFKHSSKKQEKMPKEYNRWQMWQIKCTIKAY